MQSLLQANLGSRSIASPLMASDMLKHLGRVVRHRRKKEDVMLAEVAARFRVISAGKKKTEGAFSRFERGETQPNYLDFVVDAYATELKMDPEKIWADALTDWLEDLKRPGDGDGREFPEDIGPLDNEQRTAEDEDEDQSQPGEP